MKRLCIFLALAVASLPAVSEAGCGWFPGKAIAARRAAGKGIGQKNGPAKVLLRGVK